MTSTTKTTAATAREALEHAGCTDYLVGLDGPAAQEYLGKIAARIDEFVEEYDRRFQQPADPFKLLKENPNKGAAFFQAIAQTTASVAFRVMVWRLLHGAEIDSMQANYVRLKEFSLQIRLKSPRSVGRQSDDEVYESEDLHDFLVLQHFAFFSV